MDFIRLLKDDTLFMWLRFGIAFAAGAIVGWYVAAKYYQAKAAEDQLELRKKLDFSHPIVDPDKGLIDEEGHQLCPRCWNKQVKVRLTGMIPYCTLCHYDSNKDEL